MINKEKSLIQKILPHLIAVLLFASLTTIYFSPLVQGKVIKQQSDVTQYLGSAQEIKEYYKNEGESSAWTGTSFSGMPSYQIGVWGSSPNILRYIEAPIRSLAGNTAAPVFLGMLIAYILFISIGFRPVVAIAGAIAYSLSSYNLIIIEAGHINKAWAIAYMPMILAALMVLFKRKYLLGGLLMTLGLALQLHSNHLQMTYYTAMLCAFIFLALAIDFVKKKEYKGLLKATGILIIAVVLAALANFSGLYSNQLMAEESIRGESELTPTDNTSGKKSTGLDKDYVFGWSYGKAETLSLLIPNIHGGASGGTLTPDSHLYKDMVKKGYGSQLPAEGMQSQTYWGSQPFTSGPVYFGAIICFLFVLGMFVIQNRLKWVFLFVSLFFIQLAWGKNFEVLNDFFFYHFPLYNKFRTVSSILVIPALTMVILAIWGLKDFFSENLDSKKRLKALYISAGITGGLCLFFWIAPGFFFNFIAESDITWKAQMPEGYYEALLLDRKYLLSSDALRSFIFIVLATGVLWASLRSKMDVKKLSVGATAIIALLILIDLWGVDKRYLGEDKFVSKLQHSTPEFVQSNADKFILEDKTPSYRVLSTRDPFSNASTSYYHKSIGGYNAVKLKRYQELIDFYLAKEVQYIGSTTNQMIQGIVSQMEAENRQLQPNDISNLIQDNFVQNFEQMKILNMLNAKYIIYHPELKPLVNPHAMGNVWFVDNYKIVNDANEEMAALADTDLRKTAIIDKRFEQEVSGLALVADSTASISLAEYKPNKLTYKSKANSDQLAVFSEIYFADGWEVSIDGQPAPYFRADWTLRGMKVPAGEHQIVFEFIPHKFNTAATTTTIFSALVLLLLVGGIVYPFVRKKDKE